MSNLFWLTDEQMARLQPYFPKSHGRQRVDDRRVLSGIIFVTLLCFDREPCDLIWAIGYSRAGYPWRCLHRYQVITSTASHLTIVRAPNQRAIDFQLS
ncbi:hypothetical protein Oant_4814 (plasmid) [Brucella anthropi ATCC 49188]|uniref:Transposase n=1 Tax=Brucella anthropi (strain ATCC 49188 / DSM 6882 / CCUG 24695 / JCM 21032 / LMG 3331 / NBRC 15819 / NCTC 12168 / Alc 37) TaxID=439375 RepID=A6X846_BRUA4|nr:hypothetical protein Oant_4814 [Brucella anthropi ATCC 49188]CDN96359.1 Putative transposase for insertion sequence element [Agrobacterium tumefaciens]SUB56069.1 Transposase and inactivated derivatives [Brucella anthropi]SUB56184.1 Transposase and inactivated derivatives [Brucella anthropi]